MVNHIHVHRANAQPLLDYPILAGQATTPNLNPNVNTETGTGTGTGTAAETSDTAKTSSATAATSTGVPSTTPNSPTTTVAGTTSATTNGGPLGGLLSTHSTSSPLTSTTSTAINTLPVITPTATAAHNVQSTSVVETAQSGSPSVVSTIIQTLSPSSSSSPSSPPSTSNPDAGPIAGGVIGSLFAVAALGMIISFLLRRRRRKQIDKDILGAEIFGGSGYRRSTIFLEEVKGDQMDSDKFTPRPPSMIERRVGTPSVHGNFAGGASDPTNFAGTPVTYGSGEYRDSNVYGAPAPGYPPQPMQRGYYPQGQQQSSHSPHNAHFQQPGYNQAYPYNQPHGGSPVPSRAQTPQTPGNHHHLPASSHELPNPFGARSDAGHADVAHGGHDRDRSVESAGASAARERRRSGQSDYAHHPSEELPAYGLGFDETKYAELHRDSKPRPDSIDVHGAAM